VRFASWTSQRRLRGQNSGEVVVFSFLVFAGWPQVLAQQPSLQSVQACVVESQVLADAPLKQMEEVSRRTALAPEVRIDARLGRDRRADHSWYNASGAVADFLPGESRVEQLEAVDLDLSVDLVLGLKWDLRRLGPNADTLRVVSERRYRADRRLDVLDHATALYFERLRLLAIGELGPRASEGELLVEWLRAAEIEGQLDALCGGAFLPLLNAAGVESAASRLTRLGTSPRPATSGPHLLPSVPESRVP